VASSTSSNTFLSVSSVLFPVFSVQLSLSAGCPVSQLSDQTLCCCPPLGCYCLISRENMWERILNLDKSHFIASSCQHSVKALPGLSHLSHSSASATLSYRVSFAPTYWGSTTTLHRASATPLYRVSAIPTHRASSGTKILPLVSLQC